VPDDPADVSDDTWPASPAVTAGWGSDGGIVGTLNPMNPYKTSRIGLRKLKKQKGRYEAVGTPSTPEM
jgi:hypothetical protein